MPEEKDSRKKTVDPEKEIRDRQYALDKKDRGCPYTVDGKWSYF